VTVRESIPATIEHFDALDLAADPLQAAARVVVPQGSSLKDLLSGTWLGHPLHPPLTDVVVGSWTSAFLLDLLGGDDAEEAADLLLATGVLAALPTALSGLSDWSELGGGSRRLGVIHAVGNSSALLLQALSLRARRRRERARGVALSALAFGIASFSAWLGGHLSFSKGVGVNQTAFHAGPDDWTPVLDDAQLPEGTMVGAQVGQTPLLLLRRGDAVYALDDRCAHRGCALHEGRLDGETITCPCHGSTFRLDGSLLKGPATSPQPRFAARVREGTVEVRAVDD
jgi:nitrite reductase/ring-hydroxylating ferredoxin subunit/uncharacterized membrane protein